MATFIIPSGTSPGLTFLSGVGWAALTGTVVVPDSVGPTLINKYDADAQSWSNVTAPSLVQTHLAAPANLAQSEGATTTSVTITWDAVSGATAYEVDLTADTFATFVGVYHAKSVTGATIVFSGLTADTTYYARVRATNKAKGYISPSSDKVEVVTAAS